jgi:hypothetical protein
MLLVGLSTGSLSFTPGGQSVLTFSRCNKSVKDGDNKSVNGSVLAQDLADPKYM